MERPVTLGIRVLQRWCINCWAV